MFNRNTDFKIDLLNSCVTFLQNCGKYLHDIHKCILSSSIWHKLHKLQFENIQTANNLFVGIMNRINFHRIILSLLKFLK